MSCKWNHGVCGLFKFAFFQISTVHLRFIHVVACFSSLFWELQKYSNVWIYQFLWGFPGGSDSKESACISGHLGSFLWLGRSPGGGHGNPLQCSCLENSRDRGAWGATIRGVTKESDMTKHVHTSFFIHSLVKAHLSYFHSLLF